MMTNARWFEKLVSYARQRSFGDSSHFEYLEGIHGLQWIHSFVVMTLSQDTLMRGDEGEGSNLLVSRPCILLLPLLISDAPLSVTAS